MAAFEYQALTPSGKKKKGVLEADNERHARQKLRDMELVALQIRQGKALTDKPSLFSPAISIKDRALVTRQLATLIDAGLPIEESLAGVANQAGKQKTRAMLLAIRSKVLEGQPLAAAIGLYPKAFPILYRASIKAGEESGHLAAVLMALADFSERTRANNQKVQMALLYPAILTLVAISIVVFLLGSVMPDIVSVFNKQGAELPGITQVMLGVSDAISDYGQVILLAFAGLLVCYAWLIRKPRIKSAQDSLLLKVPFIGRFVKTIQITRYIGTLAMLTSSGVALVEAMNIASQVVENDRMARALLEARDRVKEGVSLGDTLNETKLLPPMMLQLIISGERSGELDKMLNKAAYQQEQDSNNWISAMVALFEPIMLLVMGAVVMMIVMAILLPIMNMNQLLN
ncbi:type II secretion system inner membrane protein GspF [Rhodanobacter aciditrophus]|uniref:General secretion pathway protein F n=1 Tax=Rhodanobacter aciditrophus TaxID=1623218 RepID=A0ABW4AY58_9GAMM